MLIRDASERDAAACAALYAPYVTEDVGTYRRIGFKHGSWHHMAWMQRMLDGGADPPAEPT